MNEAPPTVFLVDDEPAVLRAVSRLLRAAGLRTAEFDSARRFLEQLDAAAAGCVVLDLAMPGLDGIAVQDALAERDAALPVVFLTGRADVPSSVRAMKRGAADFLTKPVDEATLLDAVERALTRGRAQRRERDERDRIRERLATLTPREREVLALVVSGLLNKQAALELGTAEKTIKVHRGRVMEKMGAASLADLVRMAERAGVGAGEPAQSRAAGPAPVFAPRS